MLNIFNVELTEFDKLDQKFKKIFGINWHRSLIIRKELKLPYNSKLKKINDLKLTFITTLIKNKYKFNVENDLKNYNYENIKFYKNLKNYKGYRHLFNLSVRGQRTKTNCRTQRKYNN